MASSVIFSAADPGAIGAGKFWLTPTGQLYVRNGANTGWVNLCTGVCSGFHNHFCIHAVFDADYDLQFAPTLGNLLLVIATQRNGGDLIPGKIAGWTIVRAGSAAERPAFEPSICVYAKVSDGTETSIKTAAGSPIDTGGIGVDLCVYEIAGFGLADIGPVVVNNAGLVQGAGYSPGVIVGAGGLFFAAWSVREDSGGLGYSPIAANGFTADLDRGLEQYPKGLIMTRNGAGGSPVMTYSRGDAFVLQAEAIGFSIG